MNKLFRRFVAYMIDMMVILLVAQCLSGIPYINKQLDDYNKYYNEYMDVYENYASFKTDLSKDFEDEKLSEEEYNSLVEDHEEYDDVLNKYYKDGEFSSKDYDKLNESIDDEYNNTYEELYYMIEKNSVVYFIIYLVGVSAYFVGFNKYTGGQTLGKKLMRLKIVNNKDESAEVKVWSYIVRALILYQPIYYIVKLVSVSFMDASMYYDVTSIFYEVQGYLEMLIIAMIMIRIDGRGPQDLLAGTRVMLYDKNGMEVKDKLDMLISNKKNNVNKNSKKVVDEEPTE